MKFAWLFLLCSTALAQPNIIFIVTDDMRRDDADSLPNILALIRNEGMEFTNSTVPVSLCCPSRASILTGLYAHNHGVHSNVAPDGGFEAFYNSGYEQYTMATNLKAFGYRTALIGKYFNSYGGKGFRSYIPPGWDEWYATVSRYYNYRISYNGVLTFRGSAPSDYDTDVMDSLALSFISRSAEPFFLYLAPNAPHRVTEWAPRHANRFTDAQAPRPPSFNEADVSDKPQWVQNASLAKGGQLARVDDRYRGRLRTLLAVDEMVKDIVDTLTALGEIENTYIIFTSDNGFEQGEHRIMQGKQTPYEEAIMVPLFIRGPGIEVGSSSDLLVSDVDYLPTMIEIAGGSSLLDGHSLLPILHGESTLWRSAVLIEHWVNADTTVDRNIPTNQQARFQSSVYTEYSTGEKEYYDLTNDPYQLQSDLSILPENAVSTLAQLRACSGADCFPVDSSLAKSNVSITDPRLTNLVSYPNPFNPTTQVRWTQKAGHSSVRLYNILGQEVMNVFDGELKSGEQSMKIDGSKLSSGIYFVRLETQTGQQTIRIGLLK